MKIDVKLREELAQELYEESDRTGVAWVRRPESVKHAFREAAERKLKVHNDGCTSQNHGHNHDRPRHGMGPHRPPESGHKSGHKGKPVMEPCTR